MSYFSDYIAELKRTAVHLEQPVMERMRRDLSQAYAFGMSKNEPTPYQAHYESLALSGEESFDQIGFRNAFGGSVPKTLGEAQDLLTKANYPAWMSFAHTKSGLGSRGQDYAHKFEQTFQTMTTNFLSSLADSAVGRWRSGTGYALQRPYYMRVDEEASIGPQPVMAGEVEASTSHKAYNLGELDVMGDPQKRLHARKPKNLEGTDYSSVYRQVGPYRTTNPNTGKDALHQLYRQIGSSRAIAESSNYYVGGSDMALFGYNAMAFTAEGRARVDYASGNVPFGRPDPSGQRGPRPFREPGFFSKPSSDIGYASQSVNRSYTGESSTWNPTIGEFVYADQSQEHIAFPDTDLDFDSPQAIVGRAINDLEKVGPQSALQVAMGRHFGSEGKLKPGIDWFTKKLSGQSFGGLKEAESIETAMKWMGGLRGETTDPRATLGVGKKGFPDPNITSGLNIAGMEMLQKQKTQMALVASQNLEQFKPGYASAAREMQSLEYGKAWPKFIHETMSHPMPARGDPNVITPRTAAVSRYYSPEQIDALIPGMRTTGIDAKRKLLRHGDTMNYSVDLTEPVDLTYMPTSGGILSRTQGNHPQYMTDPVTGALMINPLGRRDLDPYSPRGYRDNPLPGGEPRQYTSPEDYQFEGQRRDLDIDKFVRLKHPPKPQVMEVIKRLEEGNVFLKAQTGWGKTSAMIAAAGSRGSAMSIITSPLTDLNKQLAERFSDAGIESHFLPGHPGHGAPAEEVAEYEGAHQKFYDDLGVSFEEGEVVATGKGKIQVDAEGKWSMKGAPMSAHMSFEKAAILKDTKLGSVFRKLDKEGLMSFVAVDEAHELTAASRHMGRYLEDSLSDVASGARRLFVSGSVSSEQMGSISAQHDVPEGNIVRVPYKRDESITWRAIRAVGSEEQIAAAVEESARTEGAGLIMSRIEQQPGIAKGLREKGLEPYRYHKRADDPLPKAELEAATEKIISGEFAPKERLVASTAAGTGVNLNVLESGVDINPISGEAVLQHSGRLRTGEEGQQRTYSIISSEASYYNRGRRIKQTGEVLADPNALAGIYRGLRTAHEAGRYDKNWKLASRQMQADIGGILNTEGLYEHAKASIPSYLQEGGFISLTAVTDPDTNEQFFGYKFNDPGTQSEVAARIGDAQVRRSGKMGGDMSTTQSITDKIRSDTEVAVRSQVAMGSAFEQATTAGFSAEKAGEFVRRSAEAYERGGIREQEAYSNIGLPKQISEEYVDAVKGATKAYIENTAEVSNLSGHQKVLAAATNEAYKMISDNVNAKSYAREEGLSMMAAGEKTGSKVLAAAGAQIASHTGGMAAGAYGGDIPITPAPGPAAGGRMAFTRSPGAAALYGLYMAKRMWQYTAAGTFTQAQEAMGQDYLAPSLVGGGGPSYAESISGMPGRLSMAQYVSGAATLENFGAYMELPSALGGGEPGGVSRMGSLGMTGLGVAGAGVETGMGLLMSGSILQQAAGGTSAAASLMMGIGGALPIAGAAAAAGLIGIGGAVELGNLAGGAIVRAHGVEPTQQFGIGELGRMLGRNIYGLATGGHGLFSGLAAAFPNFPGADTQFPDTPMGDWLRGPQMTEGERQVRGQEQRLIRDYGGQIGDYGNMIRRSRAALGGTYEDLVSEFVGRAPAVGVGAEEYMATYESIGAQMGYRIGGPEMFALMQEMSRPGFGAAQLQAKQELGARTAGFIGQLSPFMGTPTASALVSGGIDTPAEAGVMQQIAAGVTAFGGDMNKIIGYDPKKVTIQGTTAYGVITPASLFAEEIETFGAQRVGDIWGIFGESLLASGVSPDQMPAAIATAAIGLQDVSAGQMPLVGAITGGDMRARSYAAHYQPDVLSAMGISNAASRMYGPAGRPIYKTSGEDFYNMGVQQFAMGTPGTEKFGELLYARGAALQSGTGMTGVEQAQFMVPGISEGMAGALYEGGTIGAQQWATTRLYELQMASIGTQAAAIRETQSFLWGGGDYTGQPAEGSYWDLEDDLKKSKHKAQLRQFEFQKTRMDTSNQFAIQREAITLDRMDAGQEYQRFQLDYQGQRLGMQREWMKEDWDYQDQMRGLTQGWAMEDIDEAIRYSTGRERRQLETKRDRMGITQGMEGERIGTMRERQEETMALEEERFAKQQEYTETMMDSDREGFELSVLQRETLYAMDREELEKKLEDYEEQYEIQNEMIELNREHQAAQMEFQLALLGIAAEQAKVQHDLQQTTLKSALSFEDMEGSLALINTYDKAAVAFETFKIMAEAIDTTTLAALGDLAIVIKLLNNLTLADLKADLQYIIGQ